MNTSLYVCIENAMESYLFLLNIFSGDAFNSLDLLDQKLGLLKKYIQCCRADSVQVALLKSP